MKITWPTLEVDDGERWAGFVRQRQEEGGRASGDWRPRRRFEIADDAAKRPHWLQNQPSAAQPVRLQFRNLISHVRMRHISFLAVRIFFLT